MGIVSVSSISSGRISRDLENSFLLEILFVSFFFLAAM